MTFLQITAPAVEPVTLPEAKAHCRVDHDDEDTAIGALIVAAREQAEAFLRRRLITQTVQMRRTGLGCAIRLPVAPVQEIASITYLDTAGTEQTLAADQYRLAKDGQPWRIVPAHLAVWPAVLSDVDTVGINIVVGYGDAATDVPQAIRTAILMMIGQMYYHREAGAGGYDDALPAGARALLMPHVLWV